MTNSVRVILNKQWDLICNFSIFQRWRSFEYATRILVSDSVINFGIYVSLICCEQPKEDIDHLKVAQNNKPNINVV